ncbi:MAG: NEW3 domain-containing protein [Patescibacteria group bacterium]
MTNYKKNKAWQRRLYKAINIVSTTTLVFYMSAIGVLLVPNSVQADVGNISILGINGSGIGPYYANGNWSPVGGQPCYNTGNGFRYFIEVFEDLNNNQQLDGTETTLQSIIPAACGSVFSGNPGGNLTGGGDWPAVGQTPNPVNFNLTTGDHYICAVLKHVTPSGNDLVDTDCLSNPVYVPGCGNNVIDPGEECGEPGLTTPPHNICNQCKLVPQTYCGDSTKQTPNDEVTGGPLNDGNEACDGTDGVGAHQSCSASCELVDLTYCGDGVKQAPNDEGTGGLLNDGNEACDGTDGIGAHQSCSATCELEDLTYCGDGIKQTPNNEGTGGPLNDGNEACDGNDGLITHYTCDNQCTLEYVPYCGDRSVDQGEQCDDGNANGGDGCSDKCEYELGSISGLKFNDLNKTATNESEPGIRGVTINLLSQCDPDVNSDTVVNLVDFAVFGTYYFGGINYNGITGDITGDGVMSSLDFDCLKAHYPPSIPQIINGMTVIASTTTDPNGNYSFNNLGAGTYHIAEVITTGWLQTSPGSPNMHGPIIILAGQNLNNYDFGNYQPLCGNNILDEGEKCDGTNGITSDQTCSNICALIEPTVAPLCGDGIKNGTEECDDTDGITGGQTCSASCTIIEPTPTPAPEPKPTPQPQVLGEVTNPILGIEKEVVDVTFANPGDTVQYMVTLSNSGEGSAYNVVLQDTLPNGFTYAEGDTTQTWELGDLQPGDSTEVNYSVKIADDQPAGNYDNIAIAHALNNDNVTDMATLEVRKPAVLGEVAGAAEELADTGIALKDYLILGFGMMVIILGYWLVNQPQTGRKRI